MKPIACAIWAFDKRYPLAFPSYAADLLLASNMLFSATLSYRVRELAFEQMNSTPNMLGTEQKTGHRIKKSFSIPLMKRKCVYCKR